MTDLAAEACTDLDAPPRGEKRGTGGRPSQADALRRDARLVDCAARVFLERGFDGTTIDAVAEAANVGKATLYARYRDKSALFAAVFRREVDRWLAPLGDVAAADSVRDTLLNLARAMMAQALAPEAVAINRIILAQAQRFPDLARMVHEEGWLRSNAAVAALLALFARDGRIVIDDPERVGDFFLSLVIGRQTRLAMLGIETTPADVDARIVAAVDLFLNGVAPRRRP